MKKIIIIVISILVVGFGAIVLVNYLGNSSNNHDTSQAKNILFINYGADEVNDINVYFGEETYYISKMKKENINYISVLDLEYELVLMVEENKIKDVKEITKNEAILGYKYDKLIYEVKEKNKDGYNYTYYNALDGELIKKIKTNR